MYAQRSRFCCVHVLQQEGTRNINYSRVCSGARPADTEVATYVLHSRQAGGLHLHVYKYIGTT